MALTDTAQYWQDLRKPYKGKEYYHIPNCECGHRHVNKATYVDQVNCGSCLKALSNGFKHSLLSAEQHKADTEKTYQRHLKSVKKKWLASFPDNPVCSCGFPMKKRTNNKNGQAFWGCTQYPRCKCTKHV